MISKGLCPGCHSGKKWLDHTHYICVSVPWCQVAACVVDPISRVPGSQLHQRREKCILPVGGRLRGRMPRGAFVRAAACPRKSTVRIKAIAKGSDAQRFQEPPASNMLGRQSNQPQPSHGLGNSSYGWSELSKPGSEIAFIKKREGKN